MSMSFDQAIALIQNQTLTLNQLIDLARNTTGAVAGASSETQYYLYSGSMQNGVNSFRVVDELVEMSQERSSSTAPTASCRSEKRRHGPRPGRRAHR